MEGGGGVNPYRGVVYRMGGGKPCFSLMMYGFCSNNAIYLASLSSYYFFFFYLLMRLLLFRIKSQPNVAYQSVVYKKHLTLFCSLLNVKK